MDMTGEVWVQRRSAWPAARCDSKNAAAATVVFRPIPAVQADGHCSSPREFPERATFPAPASLHPPRWPSSGRGDLGKYVWQGEERHTCGATVDGLVRRASRSVLVVPYDWTADRSERLTPDGMSP